MRVPSLSSALVLSLLLAASSLAQESFRVMSWNLRSAAGNGNLGLFGITLPHIPDPTRGVLGDQLRTMQAEAVDLVGLQEVQARNLRSFLTDQAGWLADNLGFEHRWAGQKKSLLGIFDRTGIAVLTRYPILEDRSFPVWDGSEGLMARTAQVVRVAHPAFPRGLVFVNTHMNGRGGRPEADRIREMEAVARVVRGMEGPLVLTGDLNADPDDPQIRFLEQGGLGRRMTDAARAARRGPQPTSPAIGPRRRIDYVFASPELEVLDCHTVPGAEGFSDHLPVVAALRPRARAVLLAGGALPGAAVPPRGDLLGQ